MLTGALGESDSGSGRIPGDPGVWLFIAADMLAFTALFGVHLYLRSLEPELFSTTSELTGVVHGTVNTMLLLTSSWFVACGLNSQREGSKLTTLFFWGGFGCGLLFCVVKYIEWNAILSQGIQLDQNGYWSSYFVLTGMHLYHVLVGLGVLAYLALSTKRDKENIEMFESGAVYWHMIDFLWIMIFVLFYVVA